MIYDLPPSISGTEANLYKTMHVHEEIFVEPYNAICILIF